MGVGSGTPTVSSIAGGGVDVVWNGNNRIFVKSLNYGGSSCKLSASSWTLLGSLDSPQSQPPLSSRADGEVR